MLRIHAAFPAVFVAALCFVSALQAADDTATKPPAVGEQEPEFSLKNLDGKTVSLADAHKNGPTVLVMLRGYPGYQCPICTKQFGELLSKATAGGRLPVRGGFSLRGPNLVGFEIVH